MFQFNSFYHNPRQYEREHRQRQIILLFVFLDDILGVSAQQNLETRYNPAPPLLFSPLFLSGLFPPRPLNNPFFSPFLNSRSFGFDNFDAFEFESNRIQSQSTGSMNNIDVSSNEKRYQNWLNSAPKEVNDPSTKAQIKTIKDTAQNHLCPITYEIMSEPVTADGTIFYEKEAIEQYFNNVPQKKDPITKVEKNLNDYRPALQKKNEINAFINNLPVLKLDNKITNQKTQSNKMVPRPSKKELSREEKYKFVNESIQNKTLTKDMIPTKYFGAMTQQIMDNPGYVDKSGVRDKKADCKALEQWSRMSNGNYPFNNNHLQIQYGINDVKPDLSLRQEIDNFVNDVVAQMNPNVTNPMQPRPKQHTAPENNTRHDLDIALGLQQQEQNPTDNFYAGNQRNGLLHFQLPNPLAIAMRLNSDRNIENSLTRDEGNSHNNISPLLGY